MVQFCYLRLYLGIETVSCRLLQRMVRMDLDWNLKNLGFLAMTAKITKKLETFRFEDENDYEYEIWFKDFSRIVKNWHPGILHCTFFPPEKIALLSLLNEVEPSPDCNMLKRLTFDNLFPPQRHSR